MVSCISYYSYIKPQPTCRKVSFVLVVYRTIPTSNHNLISRAKIILSLYIVLFLHQTTTILNLQMFLLCCISYYSYIKPQQINFKLDFPRVVYRTIPTSNHNNEHFEFNPNVVVYRTIPTSNHNLNSRRESDRRVVYRTIPTSNHNRGKRIVILFQLYIVLFLHQTTTV